MQFLCLAYGSEEDWKALTPEQQQQYLAQDEVIRNRGALMAAVDLSVTTVSAWDGTPHTTTAPFAAPNAPLAGFSIIEADTLDEVIQLVSGTPCARAGGAIEVRPIARINGGTVKPQ